MLLEFSGVCQHCGAEIAALILNGERLADCVSCGESPFELRAKSGIIYVVKNDNQTGVKVGLTTKTLEQRLKALSGTGVPGAFRAVAIFPSDRLRQDEAKVHRKLSRFRLAKEHFDVDPIDAVLTAYRALNKRRPIFFSADDERTFDLRLEQARIEMQLRLSGNRRTS